MAQLLQVVVNPKAMAANDSCIFDLLCAMFVMVSVVLFFFSVMFVLGMPAEDRQGRRHASTQCMRVSIDKIVQLTFGSV